MARPTKSYHPFRLNLNTKDHVKLGEPRAWVGLKPASSSSPTWPWWSSTLSSDTAATRISSADVVEKGPATGLGTDWEGWKLFSLITSELISPAVYRSVFDPSMPAVVQLAPIFTGWIGWQSLLAISQL